MSYPSKQMLEAGKTYLWCACGKSSTNPFCDGAHKGLGIPPIHFTVPEDKTVFLCNCQKTAKAPYCDGSHHK